ncbi:MAG TPA: alpha/beta hydrolase [Chloroflexia bacterium]|nr:alpha/beta hydrolase [Chloroflexia bacterium]
MGVSTQTTTGTLQTEGGPLYYEVAGEGHPLVFMHAGVADNTMWDEQWDEFAKCYRVIRYDTRGFGKSPVAKDHPFSNRHDLYELLKHLDVEKAYVVGLSRSGQIALDFTLEHPEMVDALVWVAGGVSGYDGDMPSDAEMAIFNEMEAIWEKKDWETLSEMEADVWVNGPGQPKDRADAQVHKRVHQMILNNYTNHPDEGKPIQLDPPAAGRLQEVKIPTLIIVGDLDTSSTQASANYLASSVEGAKRIVFEGVAHMVNMEQPERFNRVVLDFLSDVDSKQ